MSRKSKEEDLFANEFSKGEAVRKLLKSKNIVSPVANRTARLDSRTVIYIPDNIKEEDVPRFIACKRSFLCSKAFL